MDKYRSKDNDRFNINIRSAGKEQPPRDNGEMFGDTEKHISPSDLAEIIMMKSLDEDNMKRLTEFNRHMKNCSYCSKKYNAYLNIIEILDR